MYGGVLSSVIGSPFGLGDGGSYVLVGFCSKRESLYWLIPTTSMHGLERILQRRQHPVRDIGAATYSTVSFV